MHGVRHQTWSKHAQLILFARLAAVPTFMPLEDRMPSVKSLILLNVLKFQPMARFLSKVPWDLGNWLVT